MLWPDEGPSQEHPSLCPRSTRFSFLTLSSAHHIFKSTSDLVRPVAAADLSLSPVPVLLSPHMVAQRPVGFPFLVKVNGGWGGLTDESLCSVIVDEG